jgi:AraC-like DNA-binding protein
VDSTIAELQNAVLQEDQLKSINELLLRLLSIRDGKIESSIHHAIMHLSANSLHARLEEVRASLKITERTFERKFEQYVGVSPKLFLRICRFRESLQQINQKSFTKLSDVAYENGYADQSHFIRTFKEFTGLSPLEYHKLQAPAKHVLLPH